MRILSMQLLVLASIATPLAMAAETKIEISSPADGAKLDAMEQNKIDYNVTLGNGADHIHVYVDGKEAALLRQTKGSYTMETLPPGNHELCIKIVNKNHTPIGVERCIKVEVQ
ncbi:MAG: Ig-like domain-containing protein [Gallionella sp.]